MNPVALITGGSRGIGRGIALELARAGHDLMINYAGREDAARQTALECEALAGGRIRAVICQADIGVAGDRARLVERVRGEFGHLEVLVNNAGIAPRVRADLLETGEESFDELMRVNVKGPFFLTQQVARWMIEQGAAGGAAAAAAGARAIVTVSSISAYTASVNRGEYCVAKAALSMITPLFAARLAQHGIRVYEIRPGVIATDMTAGVKEKYDRLIGEGLTPIRRWGEPADVGRAVAAIALGYFPFSTGEVFNVDGGFHLRRL